MLIIEAGPMTRSRTKPINQAMGLFMLLTIDETTILAREEASFLLGSKAEMNWINAIQATEGGGMEPHACIPRET